MALETTALQSLEVSNHTGYFVYKDVSGAIFYFTLEPVTSSGGDESVDLNVFGVEDPGPSITVQLTRLLHKRILNHGVEALSSKLHQNPSYMWRPADIHYVESYEQAWQSMDDEIVERSLKAATYALPGHVYDPLSLVLYMRQNIGGSTFLHHLNEGIADDETGFRGEADVSPSLDEDEIIFDPKAFVFFYNNTPSALNPNFQSLSTLTEKGAEYARGAGNGIAIIRVSLVNARQDTISRFRIKSGADHSMPALSLEDLRLKRCVSDSTMEVTDDSAPLIKVCIWDTALGRKPLHEWVLLCLNQVLIGWTAERYIERHTFSPTPSQHTLSGKVDKEKLLRPGMDDILHIMESCWNLPHPAVKKIELVGVIEASGVAALAVRMLEFCIAESLVGEGGQEVLSGFLRDVSIARSSRSNSGCLVRVHQGGHRGELRALDDSQSTRVLDSPIDCPEYLCCYWYHEYHENGTGQLAEQPPMLFKEVVVNEGVDGKRASKFEDRLQELRARHKSVFLRSFAFVLTVKRNKRTLLTYNWDPQLFKT